MTSCWCSLVCSLVVLSAVLLPQVVKQVCFLHIFKVRCFVGCWRRYLWSDKQLLLSDMPGLVHYTKEQENGIAIAMKSVYNICGTLLLSTGVGSSSKSTINQPLVPSSAWPLTCLFYLNQSSLACFISLYSSSYTCSLDYFKFDILLYFLAD